MDLVEDIKNQLAIEDLIGQYIALKRTGRNFKGLSPFTHEKTPSFVVSPEKQIWHDFSSNKGGDIFSFIMEVEGLDFKEALNLLANKAGIDLSAYQKSRSRSIDKNKYYQINSLAIKFYQAQLKVNKPALNYLINERQFNKSTLLDWQIGYAPNTGQALAKYLLKQGYNPIDLKLVGLVSLRGSQTYDMFRSRIMIPLYDAQANPIGFTGRVLDVEANGPKYLNTPQTSIYDKSRHVFGLHLAKAAIRLNNYCVIVEGNLDVISSYQAGVKQVVATAGTALTANHLKAIAKLTTDLRLCLDNDRAGLNATERAIKIAISEHIPLNIIKLAGAKDPDELIKSDVSQWQEAINSYSYAIDWLIDYNLKIFSPKTGLGVKQFSDALMPILRSISDPVEQNHYIKHVAKILDVSEQSIIQKVLNNQPVNQSYRKVQITKTASVGYDIKSENLLLAIMKTQPDLVYLIKDLPAAIFNNRLASELFRQLIQPDLKLKIDEKYVKILELEYEELYQNLETNDLINEAKILINNLVQNYVKQEKAKITELLKQAKTTDTQNLLLQASKLDQLLNKVSKL